MHKLVLEPKDSCHLSGDNPSRYDLLGSKESTKIFDCFPAKERIGVVNAVVFPCRVAIHLRGG